jgi:hypothetical protein
MPHSSGAWRPSARLTGVEPVEVAVVVEGAQAQHAVAQRDGDEVAGVPDLAPGVGDVSADCRLAGVDELANGRVDSVGADDNIRGVLAAVRTPDPAATVVRGGGDDVLARVESFTSMRTRSG